MSDIRFDDKVVIVTGAGGGIGRAHALLFAKHGAKVIVNDLGGSATGEGANSEAALKVVEEIKAMGGTAVANPDSVVDGDKIVQCAMDNFGRIDVVVNNAGILRDKSFSKMTLDDFRLVVDVHLMGAAICSKAVWEIMRAQTYGRIVMTTSSSGLYGNFGQANYGAAKLAQVGLMQTLAIEGAKYNIKVNALAPTAATQMTAGILSEEVLKALDPALVSPGLLALVGEAAPTRAILCAGGGHFATANITLTPGVRIGGGADAGEQLIARWDEASNREGEIVPDFGFQQGAQEMISAGVSAPMAAG